MKSTATSRRKPKFREEFPEMEKKIAERVAKEKKAEEDAKREAEAAEYRKNHPVQELPPATTIVANTVKRERNVCFLCSEVLGAVSYVYHKELICEKCHRKVTPSHGGFFH